MHDRFLSRSSGDLLADRRYAWAEATLAGGNGRAAADLLVQTLALAPAFAPAWHLLGTARLTFDDAAGATEAFREALRIEPDDSLGAGLALAQLGAADAATAMTGAYVRALFDGYAERFDAHLTGALRYRGPALIVDALGRAAPGRRFARALDLGCGTGLMGAAIRPLVERLEGCDLSPAMIDKARATTLYDRLVVADMIAFLGAASSGAADLVLAADVLVYVGDLAPIFAAATRALAPGGLLAFTAEAYDGDGFALGEGLRYAHGEQYLRTAAEGLRPLLIEQAALRLDRGAPVPGLVALLGKA